MIYLVLRQFTSKIFIPKKKFRDEFTVLKALAGTVKQECGSLFGVSVLTNYRNIKERENEGKKCSEKYYSVHSKEYQKMSCEQPVIPSLIPLKSLDMLLNELNSDIISLDQFLQMGMYNCDLKLLFEKYLETYKSHHYLLETTLKLLESLLHRGEIKLAEKLFDTINEKNNIVYEIMIQGYSKHNMVDDVMKYQSLMEQNNLKIQNIKTHNAILRCLHFSNINEQINKILVDIKKCGLTPNEDTFIELIKKSNNDTIEKLIKEMAFLNINITLNVLYAFIFRFRSNFINVALVHLTKRKSFTDFEEIKHENNEKLFYLIKQNLKPNFNQCKKFHNVLINGGYIHFIQTDNFQDFADNLINGFLLERESHNLKLSYLMDILMVYFPKYTLMNEKLLGRLVMILKNERNNEVIAKYVPQLLMMYSRDNNLLSLEMKSEIIIQLIQRCLNDHSKVDKEELVNNLRITFDYLYHKLLLQKSFLMKMQGKMIMDIVLLIQDPDYTFQFLNLFTGRSSNLIIPIQDYLELCISKNDPLLLSECMSNIKEVLEDWQGVHKLYNSEREAFEKIMNYLAEPISSGGDDEIVGSVRRKLLSFGWEPNQIKEIIQLLFRKKL